MESATIAFAKYASKKLRTYGTYKYDMFADICDKVLNNDKEAFNVVSRFVNYNLMWIFKHQENLCISDEDKKEYRKITKQFEKYMHKIDKGFSIVYPLSLSKKFDDEVDMYFNDNEEGNKYVKEFNLNKYKINDED